MDGIGFSTGSVARSDVRGALRLLEPFEVAAVELSALRTHELGPLIRLLPHLALDRYRYVSVHAPSSFLPSEESAIAAALLPVARRGWPVVLHPDAIHDARVWAPFGDRLCIENMDRRKPVGRTADELRPVFARLPHASFCLDLAHTRQCDPTLDEARRLLDAFGDRLAQVHVSQLDPQSRHVRLTPAGVRDFQRLASQVPDDVPLLIEAPVRPDEIAGERAATLQAMGRLGGVPCAA